ncbi:MAG TPA: proline racemase family protein [Thermomicrobiales bacterium]|jgi:proline racemase|nr:proline racemase family protein [Thermomicrobiales bacterium]
MLRVVATTIDYHTGGEPFRLVPEPPVAIPGATVAERRDQAVTDPAVDGLRRLLCSEPRGHADMYGGFIVPPDNDGAHFGVLFWHKDGFSTACGHGTIALGAWAAESGRVAAPATGTVEVRIDVPSGRVTARAHTESGRVTAVDFVNVASWLVVTDIPVATSRGMLPVTISYGGAFYAQIDAAAAGLRVEPDQLPELIALGREIRTSLSGSDLVHHPDDPRLSGIYGTIIFEDHGTTPDGDLLQRNVTIFADGEVDRSPCGSGTCARLATLAATTLLPGQALIHESIVGSRFRGVVLGSTHAGGHDAILPQVTGMAYRTGAHSFEVDPHDPLVPGFVLR